MTLSILLALLVSIKLLPVRKIAYHMSVFFFFFSTVLTFGIGGSRTLAAFEMELFVTNVDGWKL